MQQEIATSNRPRLACANLPKAKKPTEQRMAVESERKCLRPVSRNPRYRGPHHRLFDRDSDITILVRDEVLDPAYLVFDRAFFRSGAEFETFKLFRKNHITGTCLNQTHPCDTFECATNLNYLESRLFEAYNSRIKANTIWRYKTWVDDTFVGSPRLERGLYVFAHSPKDGGKPLESHIRNHPAIFLNQTEFDKYLYYRAKGPSFICSQLKKDHPCQSLDCRATLDYLESDLHRRCFTSVFLRCLPSINRRMSKYENREKMETWQRSTPRELSERATTCNDLKATPELLRKPLSATLQDFLSCEPISTPPTGDETNKVICKFSSKVTSQPDQQSGPIIERTQRHNPIACESGSQGTNLIKCEAHNPMIESHNSLKADNHSPIPNDEAMEITLETPRCPNIDVSCSPIPNEETPALMSEMPTDTDESYLIVNLSDYEIIGDPVDININTREEETQTRTPSVESRSRSANVPCEPHKRYRTDGPEKPIRGRKRYRVDGLNTPTRGNRADDLNTSTRDPYQVTTESTNVLPKVEQDNPVYDTDIISRPDSLDNEAFDRRLWRDHYDYVCENILPDLIIDDTDYHLQCDLSDASSNEQNNDSNSERFRTDGLKTPIRDRTDDPKKSIRDNQRSTEANVSVTPMLEDDESMAVTDDEIQQQNTPSPNEEGKGKKKKPKTSTFKKECNQLHHRTQHLAGIVTRSRATTMMLKRDENTPVSPSSTDRPYSVGQLVQNETSTCP